MPKTKREFFVTFPPDFDGELKVTATDNGDNVTYTFTYAKQDRDDSPRETLNVAAVAILSAILPRYVQSMVNDFMYKRGQK